MLLAASLASKTPDSIFDIWSKFGNFAGAVLYASRCCCCLSTGLFRLLTKGIFGGYVEAFDFLALSGCGTTTAASPLTIFCLRRAIHSAFLRLIVDSRRLSTKDCIYCPSVHLRPSSF